MEPFKSYVASGGGGHGSFAIKYYGGGRGGSDSSFVMQQSFFRNVSFLANTSFESFKEGCPSAEAVFQGALRLKNLITICNKN